MANDDFDLTDAALIGQLVSVALLTKLVENRIISPADAADLLDEALLQLEEWQASFPERHQAYFESARDFLSKSVDGYRATMKKPTD
jgi:hypothetical protein